jgi:hypothetical protein
MGGSLNAESPGVGQGATFTLSLPRWTEPKPGTTPPIKSPEDCFGAAAPRPSAPA